MRTLLNSVKTYFNENVNMLEFWFLAIWASIILVSLSSDYGKTEIREYTIDLHTMAEVVTAFVIMPAVIGFNMRKK